ncbi:hypothetical protein QJS10_CPB12g01337 [Acorus calamus]|uniref:Uncharacterized protein n=1 Tax=Acorus calamus TaxID=4465 RepID=A0AAV9DLT5_ACOCL|nr:hypothetical protein QJS10_CPB12g01337 [Acorus calamus]
MEALRKLEDAQRMLSFMESAGLSSHEDADSDRFLADFLHFMARPCGSLSAEKKCHLISSFLPKISEPVLEAALLRSTTTVCSETCADDFTLFTVDSGNACLLRSGMPMVGLDAMQRANSTLEDFCRSYFMFHGMDANEPKSIFRFLPFLSFTESYIYQLDNINEELLQLSSASSEGPNLPMEMGKSDGNQSKGIHLLEVFKCDPFGPLVHLLHHHGLLIERITTELRLGTEYWTLERKLCHALVKKKKISIEDVMRAIHLKSFDYRILNLLLYQLRGQEVNELHMEFLSVSEFLVEISDDLVDAAGLTMRWDDVVKNNFNILRMLVGVYGASVAPSKLSQCITEAEERYEILLNKLDPDLSSNCRKRCEEATKEGGNKSGHAFGTWNIPPVIADEESYRSRIEG